MKNNGTLMPLILASQSPRRRELLLQAGFDFTVIVPDENAEDGIRPGEQVQDFVQRLAVQKAQNVAEKADRGIIIACDTVAVCGQEVLGKPVDRDDAKRMLTLLSGQKHFVFSGLCILEIGGTVSRLNAGVEMTELMTLPVSDAEREVYLDSGAWRGKAGAFGYQDGNDWIRITHGSESNVVGLPMELLERMMCRQAARLNCCADA